MHDVVVALRVKGWIKIDEVYRMWLYSARLIVRGGNLRTIVCS